MIGTTLAHYRITGALGAGGMGEVWRATDEKLGREVALKVLSEEFASDPHRLERFEREARAVAALNHPHIVTIYSVEDSDGIRFLTMELVEGRTLDRMIPENGFDAATFFDLATPLAEAISAAHDKSVVHRDLKPSNVMVDGDDRIKVMDFGLAKQQDSGDVSDSSELPTEALTGVGMVVGTVPYMSPEQVEGKIVDHRTDIFSLGVLLYEMAMGERPFQGESAAGLMSSILRDVPQSVVEIRNDLPNHLGRIISRCLEKDRRDRYQTARDVFNELKALRRESSSIHTPSRRPATVPSRQAPRSSSSSSEVRRVDVPWIAVLPFVCPSGEGSVEAFADGLEEDIASGLSRFSYLFVVARKSTSRYRGEATDVRQVGEELGARFVMEGGIRKAGSTIRINVQIVDTETGTHLWTETFDRDLDGTAIFAIQDDITDRVVATVADPYGVVARSMAIPTAAMDPKEMTAYQAVLRYFLYQQRLSQEDHLIAREALERAVEIEPGYADAWSCLTLVVLDEDRHDFNRRSDALDRALSTARRGVESNPASSFAHYALATVYFYRRDLGSFRANAEKAIKLNRRNGNVVAMLGILYGYSGDWKRGVELTTEAMELNPHHPGWYRFTTFFDHYLKGEYEEALKVAQKINMPGYFAAHMAELLAHTRLGNTAAAENATREMLHAYPAEDMSGYGRHAEMWFYSQPDLLNEVISVLRSVGVWVDSPDGGGPTAAPASSGSTPAASPISAAKETETLAIAVLPFADMSPTKDQDYFCEGMAEEIMNSLVRIEGIRVASRTSAFRARHEGHGLVEIARLLSVSHVLEGSVRTAGSRLRITAQLTDVVSGHQLWSERFDRELEDVFAVQDEIAAGVVDAVRARLAPDAGTIPSRPQPHNLEAYRSYLLGQHLRYAKEDHGGAVRAFQEAIRLDPTHAPSWTGLAESLALSAHMSLIPADEACAGARKALSTAMELQGESADGLHGEAFVAFIERRWSDLEATVRRALELQPSHVPSLGLLGMCLSLHQKPGEAEPFFERARQADPLASFPNMLTALGLLTARRPQEANGYAEQALTFEKDDASALFCASLAKIALGRFEEGIAAAEHGVAVSHRGGDFVGLLGWALASAGREDEARTLLEELRTRPEAAPQIVSEGWLLGALGELDAAFEVFARAEDQHQLWLYYTGLPGFDSLRSDRRFAELVERLGLPPSSSAAVQGPSVEIPEIAEKSIAVLPFVNRSGSPDDEYFSDGLSEELINALSRVSDLKVTARSSAFQFRGKELDVRDVGRKLGVATVLEGSVRISGGRLRITTELVNCADGYQLWSERFDREMTDIFETQDEIARAIVAKLDVELGGATEEPLVVVSTENMEAYRLFLKARHLRGKEDHEGARRAFEQAIRLDEAHAPSWTGLAEISVLAAHFNLIPASEGCSAARKALATAAALQGESADGLHVEGLLAFIERRWAAMEAAWRRALELQPTHVLALGGFGLGLCTRQRLDEALPFLERARQADPLASFPYSRTAVGFVSNGRSEEGLRFAEDALTFEKEDVTALAASCMAKVALGRFEEGIEEAEYAVALSGRGVVFLGLLGWALATAGRDGEARAILKEFRARPATSPAVVSEAWLLGALGEVDAAFDVLARAEEEYQAFLNYTGMPTFDPLRTDPRFNALLERLGLTPPTPSDTSEPDAPSTPSGVEIADRQGSDLAVAPIECDPNDSELCSLADGLTEELTSGFAQFAYLSVRETDAVKGSGSEHSGIGEVWGAAGVRYLVTGRLHRVGDVLRLRVRVLDTTTGRRLWSESYDRTLVELDIFELQDHLADRIIATVADSNGVLVHSMAGQLRSKALNDYTPADWVVRTFAYWSQMREDEHADLRSGLESAVKRDPHRSAVWACLAQTFLDEYRVGFNPLPNSLDRALEASLRAVELDPRDSLAQESLADTHFFRRDMTSFRLAVDRALAINPRDATTIGSMGTWLALSGDLQRGFDLTQRAMEINPGYAGWYQIAIFFYHFEAGRFEEALHAAKSMNMPDFFWSHLMTAAAAGKLGLEEDARQALDRLEQLLEKPVQDARCEAEKFIVPEVLLAEFLDGLELSGLGRGPQSLSNRSSKGAAEAPRIAVLPFTDHSSGQDQEWFAAGTHEALLTALQKIGGLRVISRTSSMQYRGTTLSLREIGSELGVGWLVEGSVTRVGERVRVAASLVDASTDQQVWANQYENDVREILAQQNEVAREIAGEVQVVITPEEDLRLARVQQVDPAAYRAYVRGLHHFDRVNPTDFKRSVELFEESTSLDPKFAPAYAGLAAAYGIGVEFGWVSRAEAAPLAEHALRAVQRMDPESASAYRALANVQFHIRRNLADAEKCYRKAAELESNAYTLFEFGWLLSQSGRHEEAVALLEEVVAIDPRSPLFRCDLGWWCFGARDYDRAIEEAQFALEIDPSFAEAHWLLSIAYAEQERYEEALTELELYEVPSGYSVHWYRGYILALAGRREEAVEVLQELKQNRAPATERAYILLGLDDRAGVLEALEEAEGSDIAFQPYLWPRYEAYHDDPRFRAVLEKFGLPLPPNGDPT